MSAFIRFDPYPGDDLASRLASRCSAANEIGHVCDRIEGHDGEHVEVSGTNLVLDAWGGPNSAGGIDARTRKVIEKLARIREVLEEAIREADWEIYSLRKEYKDDEVLLELINDADVPDVYVEIGLTDEESEWPAQIDAIRRRIAKRKERAA
ncbi:hypothetical protein M1M07_23860 [Rhodococcus sp. HM1]|uniref:hypothetical protein n=1 Tax=Rhodococcus sp. HM1 TaxID=2937759 RepID=UPI00200B1CE8|nr:hypothetical protein [Rhodococcus sp. HM1]MCK8674134.1 hypothetical protein [Rhodococcus sp. HM1]